MNESERQLTLTQSTIAAMSNRTTKLPPLGESLGIYPLQLRFREAAIALRGGDDVPASRFGLSSLALLRPQLSIPLWRGHTVVSRRVIVTNLFNHLQPPREEGWSVKRTRIRDFRGRKLTYDSHNGTDFAVPRGTPVLTGAAGQVVRISREFNRGGLKIFLDHGNGLMSCSAHLARSRVAVGERLHRGQRIGTSGYSGLDGLSTFPFGVPHVHYNIWLDGEPVDPFPQHGQLSMWLNGTRPKPWSESLCNVSTFSPSEYNASKLNEAISHCKTPEVRKRLYAIEPLATRAADLLFEMNYYPTRFPQRVSIYMDSHPRTPCLNLPFPSSHFDGIAFADEL